jgi:hypothetical protein
MAEPRLTTPSINGSFPDFSQVQVHLQGVREQHVKDFSFNFECKPGEVWGTGRQVIGFTPGKGSRSGSVTFYPPGANALRAALGEKYFLKTWSLTAHWTEADGTTTSVEVTARITKEAMDASEGETPLAWKFDLLMLSGKVNGRTPW